MISPDEDEHIEADSRLAALTRASSRLIEPAASHLSEELLTSIQPLIDTNQQITGFAKFEPIELKMSSREPIFRKQYKIPLAAHTAVSEQVAKWLSRGKIKLVTSPSNLPLTVAPKVDGAGNRTGTRVCLDPRAINKLIEPDNFPIPPTREIIDSLSGHRYFTEIDLEDAFLQMKLCENDQKLLCFTWENQQYCFVGAPYGVRVMSSQFQRMISMIFHDLPHVKCYIDNIIIASKTYEEHVQHVTAAMQRINEYDLRISPKKLKLARQSLSILGYKVTADGFEADPNKVAQVLAWPFPSDCKGLQRFLASATTCARTFETSAQSVLL